MQSDLIERAGQFRVLCRLGSNDIDVLQACAAIKPYVTQIFSEKSEPFAEKEDSNQRQNHDRDKRITAKEIADAMLDQAPCPTSLVVGRLQPHDWRRNFH